MTDKKYDLLKSLEEKNKEADDYLEKTRQGLCKIIDIIRNTEEDDTQKITSNQKT